MQQIVFKTPGLIDLNAFTTFGCNAKPHTTNPIGFFGTGLKYALAVLVRERHDVFVCRGKDVYKVTAEPLDFRGKHFTAVHMVKQSKGLFARLHSNNKLPFTTELGKTWKLWQAFRELYSNTIDENGSCYSEDWNEDFAAEALPTEPNTTYIIVRGDAFYDVYQESDEIFLPNAIDHRVSTDAIQILDEPSKYIYYRGMRVLELPQESVCTYNVLKQIQLTEDRTAANSSEVFDLIRDYIVRYASEMQSKKICAAPAEAFEATLNFRYCWYTPSDTFRGVVTSLPKSNLTGVRGYIKKYLPKTSITEVICDKADFLAWINENHMDWPKDIARAMQQIIEPAIRSGQLSLAKITEISEDDIANDDDIQF